MIPEVQTIIEATLSEQVGYNVVEWGEPEEGSYIPTIEKVKNGKTGKYCYVNLNTDGSIYIYFLSNDSDHIYIQTDGMMATEEMSKEERQRLEKEAQERKLKKFKAIYEQITIEKPRKEHALFQTKNLVPYGGYVAASRVIYDVGDKHYDFTIRDSIVITFTDRVNGNVVGVQYRDKRLNKSSIKFSRAKDALHVLQSGNYDKYLGNTLGYLCESFTTACEVAEAMPNAFVACTAGITHHADVYWKIRKENPEIFLIAVLDKTKDGFPCEDETKIKERVSRWIQLDLFDNKFNGITDYNEMALKYGKGAVKKEIYRATMAIYPKLPEVLRYQDGEFTIVSAIHGGIESVRYDKVHDKVFLVMSTAALQLFAKKMGVELEV